MNVVAVTDGQCINDKEVDTVEFDRGLKWSPTTKSGKQNRIGSKLLCVLIAMIRTLRDTRVSQIFCLGHRK